MDAAFVHLRGIQTLDIGACNQETIADVAIANLVGISELKTDACRRDVCVAAAELLDIDFEPEDGDNEDDGDGYAVVDALVDTEADAGCFCDLVAAVDVGCRLCGR